MIQIEFISIQEGMLIFSLMKIIQILTILIEEN